MGKDSSTVRYGVAMKRRCVRCLVTGKDITSGEVAGERSVKDTKMIRSRFL